MSSLAHRHPLALTHAYRVSRRPRTEAASIFKKIARSLGDWWQQPPMRELAQLWGRRTQADLAVLAHDQQRNHEVAAPIPATFTSVQAKWVLAVDAINAYDKALATRLLMAWTPTRFSQAQAQCVLELLALKRQDLRATLADAMEPCELRDRLRRPMRHPSFR